MARGSQLPTIHIASEYRSGRSASSPPKPPPHQPRAACSRRR